MKQSARSFEDQARYIEIAIYLKCVHKIVKSNHQIPQDCQPVRLSVHMEQLSPPKDQFS